MRVFDNGSFFTVQVSRDEVERFNDRWPCSSIPDKPVTFEFDKGGDLVGLRPEIDGPEVLALSEDAKKYGSRKLGLNL